MPILLDSKPYDDARIRPGATVAELIDTVKTELSGTGRLLLALRCDDQELDAGRLDSLLNEPMSRFERLELISGRPEPIVLDTLEVCREALADTFAPLQEAAAALSTGRLSEAMSRLVECVAVWSQTHEALVNSARLLRIDLQALRAGDRPVVEWLNGLAEKLRELKKAIESRDFVLLGDLLRYELEATIQGWEGMLDRVIEHIEALHRAAGAVQSNI